MAALTLSTVSRASHDPIQERSSLRQQALRTLAVMAMGILSLLVCPAAVAAAAASGSGSDAGYSALCAVGRNENRYVREWVDYHKCLGESSRVLSCEGAAHRARARNPVAQPVHKHFTADTIVHPYRCHVVGATSPSQSYPLTPPGFSRIYLYDHGSSVPMSSELGPHLDSGFLHYVNFSAAHRKFQEGYTSDLERFMSTVQVGVGWWRCGGGVVRFGGRRATG